MLKARGSTEMGRMAGVVPENVGLPLGQRHPALIERPAGREVKGLRSGDHNGLRREELGLDLVGEGERGRRDGNIGGQQRNGKKECPEEPHYYEVIARLTSTMGARSFLENKEIARILGETADLMEIAGDDGFRIRSHRTAPTAIEGIP